MSHSAIKVANEFLALARDSQPRVPVTPLKIIKLVYIANGWGFPILDSRLVTEDAEAWQYGPVVPDLYHAVRRYRADPIVEPIPGGREPDFLSEREKALVKAVFRAYGRLSGTQLSSMTHLPGTPWSITWDNGRGRNDVIPESLISEHYREIARTRLANASSSGNTESTS